MWIQNTLVSNSKFVKSIHNYQNWFIFNKNAFFNSRSCGSKTHWFPIIDLSKVYTTSRINLCLTKTIWSCCWPPGSCWIEFNEHRLRAMMTIISLWCWSCSVSARGRSHQKADEEFTATDGNQKARATGAAPHCYDRAGVGCPVCGHWGIHLGAVTCCSI